MGEEILDKLEKKPEKEEKKDKDLQNGNGNVPG